ncbi:MAG: FtsX-like permease family protein, partial [Planctomycetia bacterium]
RELGATAGDRLVVRLEKASAVPKDGLLGDRSDVLRSLPVDVETVIAVRGPGRFDLATTQRLPRTLYLPFDVLAKAIEQPGRANALFLSAAGPADPSASVLPTADDADGLLRQAITLDDYGLSVRTSDAFGYLSIESQRQILEPTVVDAVTVVAREEGVAIQPILTYLANSIAVGGRKIPYSVVTALAPVVKPPLGPLPLVDADGAPNGKPLDQLSPGALVLNQWAADQLQAAPGAKVSLEYFVVDGAGGLKTASHDFDLAGVVAMTGLAVDRDFAPPYPGITDAEDFGDWKPPFDVDLDKVRKVDEDYWDEYRTAPKAFLNLADAQTLFASRHGNRTSMRLAPPIGRTPAEFAPRLTLSVRDHLSPMELGFVFQDVKKLDLEASAGSTPFGVLFLSFSFFLIAAAALLVGLLFRLNTERRASQIGLMLAVGFSPKAVRRLLVAEGALVAGVGAALGLVGAVYYAQAMIWGLATWWRAAVSTPFIEYHAAPVSFVVGWSASTAVAIGAIIWSVRRIVEVPTPILLAGGFTASEKDGPRRKRVDVVTAAVG